MFSVLYIIAPGVFYNRTGVLNIFSLIEKPCSSPIFYSIDSFDSRFGLTKEEFITVLKQAENIWEKPQNKNLFEYNENSNLKINLIFDERQAETIKNKGLSNLVELTNNSASLTNKEITNLKATYEIKKQEYLKMVEDFEIKKASYESQVIYWNNKGGAPKSEYNKLNEEKNNLLALQDSIEIKRIEVNNLSSNLNILIEKYNSITTSVNSAINEYNQNRNIVGEFREGEYVADNQGERINIYEFSDRIKLLRVLAHEFGHAIGVEHNDNAKSIMYRLNEGNSESLSKEDLQGLKTICQL